MEERVGGFLIIIILLDVVTRHDCNTTVSFVGTEYDVWEFIVRFQVCVER